MAKARLRSIAYPMAVAIATITGYGWSLETKSVKVLLISCGGLFCIEHD